MTNLDHLVVGALGAGGPAGVIQLADSWAAAGRVREAIAALCSAEQRCPADGGLIAGKLGDLYAMLGARASALECYERARAAGAPAEWADARRAWLDQRGAGDVYVGAAARDPGMWNQKGVVVLRPSYLAFVPTERATHVAAIAAKAVLAVGGVLVIQGRQIPAAHVAPYLSSLSPGAADCIAPEMARQSGGVVYDSSVASHRYESLPLGKRLSFVTRDDRILMLHAKQLVANPVFQRVVGFWPSYGASR